MVEDTIGGMEFRPLIYNAAANNNLKRLKVFLEQKRSQEWFEQCLNSDERDCIPLVIAARNGHLDIVKYLISKGSDPNVPGSVLIEGEVIDAAPPLWVAAAAGNYDVVEYLVKEAGANINQATRTNSTPLRSACYDGHLAIVKFLIENGAELETPNRHGHTPLMIAAFKGRTNVVQYLLEQGACVKKRSSKGNTALHDAAEGDHVEICELLLKYGAEIVADESGLCPVISSALIGNESVVPVLLKYSESGLLKRNALKLLGCTRCDKKMDIQGAVNAWREAVSVSLNEEEQEEVRKQQNSFEIPSVYGCDKEIDTLEDVLEIEGQPDSIYMQALMIRERIVGPSHIDVHYYLRYRGAIYCDTARTQRCFQLWLHALHLQQLHLSPLHLSIVATFQAYQETFSLALNEQANRIDQGRFYWSVNPEQVAGIFHRLCYELERIHEHGFQQCHDTSMRDHDHDPEKDKERLVLVGLQLVFVMYRLSLPSHSQFIESENEEPIKLVSNTFMDVARFVRACDCLKLLPLHMALTETEGSDFSQFPSNYVVEQLISAGADLCSRNVYGNTPLHVLLLDMKPRESIVQILLDAGAPILARNNDDNTCLDLIELSRMPTVRSGRFITLVGLSSNAVMRHICGVKKTEEEIQEFLKADDVIPYGLRSYVRLH